SDLARDMAGLAHAGHDHAAWCRADHINGRREACTESVTQCAGERIYTTAFSLQCTQGRRDCSLSAIAGHMGWLRFGHGTLIARKRLYVRLAESSLLMPPEFGIE